MRRRVSVAAALAVFLFTGSAPAGSAESPRPTRTSYTVVSRTGALVEVAALEWVPRGAKTVILALHGRAGLKENNWGPLVVPGYSLALHRYEEGRATVAIDFPGYGESEGNVALAGVDDYAFVVDQIATALRTRFDHIVGLGHSMGAIVVGITQGLFASFDAIVPAAFSHGGFSPGFSATCGQTPPACPNPRKLLFTSYADKRVVEDFVRSLFAPPSPLRDQSGVLTRREVTSRVTVPVLLLLGMQDFVFDTSKYAEEPSYYASSPAVQLVLLPRTGHAVFHHLNHGYVDLVVRKWLAQHKL